MDLSHVCALVKGGQPAGCRLLLALIGMRWSARLAYFPLHSQGPDFWCVEIFTCRGNIAWDVVGGRGLSCLACVYFLWDLGNLLLRGSQVCFLGFFCTYPQWHIHKTYLMVWRVTSSAKPFISANSTSSVLWSTSMTICLLNPSWLCSSEPGIRVLVTAVNGHV